LLGPEEQGNLGIRLGDALLSSLRLTGATFRRVFHPGQAGLQCLLRCLSRLDIRGKRIEPRECIFQLRLQFAGTAPAGLNLGSQRVALLGRGLPLLFEFTYAAVSRQNVLGQLPVLFPGISLSLDFRGQRLRLDVSFLDQLFTLGYLGLP
jgi:hypothetical protein